MTSETRQQRLAAELECLRALKKASDIFDFEAKGDPPDRYTVVFRGRGVCRDTSAKSDVETTELHRVDMRLPYSYPERQPDIRWLTPVFHPNISFSGLISLEDVGLPWDKDLGLDVICERLWDVARLSYVNLEQATNFSAKNWLDGNSELKLPVDPRPLRDKTAPTGVNVIRYERRGENRIELPAARENEDILFIDENTPIPDLPLRITPPIRRRPLDNDGILFIGDD